MEFEIPVINQKITRLGDMRNAILVMHHEEIDLH